MTEKLKKIGKYDIVAKLGEGAMGKVYKGYDPIIDRYVAIKTLSRHNTDADDQELAARFRQEAKAAGRLTHPGIVSVYDYGEEGSLTFIAMELVEGVTLSKEDSKNIQFSLEEIWELITQTLDALNYAHQKGVVHRDIKPSNIMRTVDGKIKITDFGIAHIDTSELTQIGTIIGTPGYMSPEQLKGQSVDHRSDIYSCGILLYELLTGERAFFASNITTIIYSVVNTDLPPVTGLCTNVPQDTDTVLSKALAKDPEQRFGSALEFSQAIKSISLGAHGGDPPIRAPGADSDETIIQPRAPLTPPPQPPEPVAPRPDKPAPRSGVLNPSATAPQPAESGPAQATAGSQKTEPGARRHSVQMAGAGALVSVALIASVLFIYLPGQKSEPTNTDDTGVVLPTPSDDTSKPASPPLLSPLPATSSYQPGKNFKDCTFCPEMIVIPPGTFTQGSPDEEVGRQDNEGPAHKVAVNYPLAVGLQEITVAQYARFVETTGHEGPGCTTYEGEWQLRQGRNWRSPGFEQNENKAVTCVSWNDAQEYTAWLSSKTGHQYRLPSSSEWEYITRAGTQTSRNWGDNPELACKHTNVADLASKDDYPGWVTHECTDGNLYTAPPEAFQPNDFGVYATIGNLFEWVEDCWNESYLNAPIDGSAWTTGDCNKRVLRGGSWYTQPESVRSAFRNRFEPGARVSTFGFRVVRDVPGI